MHVLIKLKSRCFLHLAIVCHFITEITGDSGGGGGGGGGGGSNYLNGISIRHGVLQYSVFHA